jgi:hypothetical protein
MYLVLQKIFKFLCTKCHTILTTSILSLSELLARDDLGPAAEDVRPRPHREAPRDLPLRVPEPAERGQGVLHCLSFGISGIYTKTQLYVVRHEFGRTTKNFNVSILVVRRRILLDDKIFMQN